MAANLLAYGFTQFDHLDRLTSTIGQQELFNAVTESAVEHNRILTEMQSALVQITTDHKVKYHLPGLGTLQPLSELGSPRKVREAGSYDVAYPIEEAGTAWGPTRRSAPR